MRSDIVQNILSHTKLPNKVVYLIEEYKFETALIFALLMTALITPLVAAAQNSLETQRFSTVAAYTSPEYPIINKQQLPQINAVQQQYAVTGTDVWPIHGLVTTEFGTPHQPWQPTHTGIDISSRARSGVTGVTIFREGTVIKIAHLRNSFGNHVIVDHGNGLTSLYGHMASISVTEGQHVVPGDDIGREGSTGASTGTHLHFEIRLNGKPVNPRQYVRGNP